MTTKNDIERRIKRIEEQTDNKAPVVVDTEEEARKYENSGRLVIYDNIR